MSAMQHPPPLEVNLLPVRALFGYGQRATLPERLLELAIAKPLLVGTVAAATRHQDVVALLDGAALATFFAAEPHCPEAIVERCRQRCREAGCDGVVAIGGGSTLGLGKILAAEEGEVHRPAHHVLGLRNDAAVRPQDRQRETCAARSALPPRARSLRRRTH